MTDTTPTPELTQAPAQAPRKTHPGKILFKGCGCLTACVILGVGVAVAGDNKAESWGSAIAGIIILILVVGTSGTNGFLLSKDKDWE